MIILTDADGVLEDLTQVWIELLNETYGRNVKYEDVVEWDMCKAYPGLTREQQISLFRSKWIEHEKPLKETIFNLLFKERIEERDRKIKTMKVDELIENLQDENGYGKFIVLEMKERYDSLEDGDKVKILDALSKTTKGNLKWAESKRKQLKTEK